MGYLTQKLSAEAKLDSKSDLRSTFERFQPETIAANKPFVGRISELAKQKGATTAQFSNSTVRVLDRLSMNRIDAKLFAVMNRKLKPHCLGV